MARRSLFGCEHGQRGEYLFRSPRVRPWRGVSELDSPAVSVKQGPAPVMGILFNIACEC